MLNERDESQGKNELQSEHLCTALGNLWAAVIGLLVCTLAHGQNRSSFSFVKRGQ